MKSSSFPILLLLAVANFAFPQPKASAENTIILANGQRREATILGVSGGRLSFKAGPVQSSLPLDQISSVIMEPPADFEQAINAWLNDDPKTALAKLKPLIQNFNGLPADWARQASATLGEILLDIDDIAAAEKAFQDFQSLYPDATELAQLGKAKLALKKNDLPTAKQLVEPLAEEAKKSLTVGPEKNAKFAKALLTLGSALEAEGRLSEALENYLLIVTVFYNDQAVARQAENRARILSTEKSVVVP